MGNFEFSKMPKVASKLWGQLMTGPMGEVSQSYALVKAPISPPPERIREILVIKFFFSLAIKEFVNYLLPKIPFKFSLRVIHSILSGFFINVPPTSLNHFIIFLALIFGQRAK